GSRTWVSATKALRGLQRLFEQALDQQRRDLDRIRKPVLVDELEAFARQVVLLVAEVREACRRNAFLVEGERVDPRSRRADAQIVTVTEAELLRETRQPVRERLWRAHQLEAIAVGDAVEVHDPLDSLQLAGHLGVEDPRARADAPDLLGGEGDEDQRARVSVAGERFGDPANALDARRVVDDARAAPDG